MFSDYYILLLSQLKGAVWLCDSRLSKFYSYHYGFEILGVSSSLLGTQGLAIKDGPGGRELKCRICQILGVLGTPGFYNTGFPVYLFKILLADFHSPEWQYS